LGKQGKPGKSAASLRKKPVEAVTTVTMGMRVSQDVPAPCSQDS
jgi:hypothetical protein